ncbi:MAG: class I SAM-dependent rRNA methyltransferase [Rhodobacteraceae bacterium]|nr:class I SAM-dependent rRNA methyltransferase [Paracoccaceae bacterium]
MTPPPFSVVRLKPKMDPRRIRFGHPWVFANELVLDRRTKALEPGTIALLEGSDREPLALVGFNSASKIVGRVLSRDTDMVIDEAWLGAKIDAALALRERLYDAPYYRLVHAEGDGLPGVVIDRFGDTAVFQANAAWADRMKDSFARVLAARGMPNVILNGTGRARGLEGLPELRVAIAGEAPAGVIPVPMNGATYMADLMGGQKTGIFFDQRPNHAFLQGFAKDARVLDVFSHVGGFGLAALAAGAAHVTAVDGSEPALNLAAEGAERMGASDRFETLQSDAFAALEAQEPESFEIVICDPPAFAPSKNALDAGLRAYERIAKLAAPLVKPGGILVLCSCSHAADLTKFRTSSLRGVGRAGRAGQILHTGYAGPDHPQHPSLAETGYLKSLLLRLA